MNIVKCPNCGKSYNVEDQVVGKNVRCKCGATFRAARRDVASDSPPARPPKAARTGNAAASSAMEKPSAKDSSTDSSVVESFRIEKASLGTDWQVIWWLTRLSSAPGCGCLTIVGAGFIAFYFIMGTSQFVRETGITLIMAGWSWRLFFDLSGDERRSLMLRLGVRQYLRWRQSGLPHKAALNHLFESRFRFRYEDRKEANRLYREMGHATSEFEQLRDALVCTLAVSTGSKSDWNLLRNEAQQAIREAAPPGTLLSD